MCSFGMSLTWLLSYFVVANLSLNINGEYSHGRSLLQNLPDGAACTNIYKNPKCASGYCSDTTKTCCRKSKNSCAADDQCCSGGCDSKGKCVKPPECTYLPGYTSCFVYAKSDACKASCSVYCEGGGQNYKPVPLAQQCYYEKGLYCVFRTAAGVMHKCAKRLGYGRDGKKLCFKLDTIVVLGVECSGFSDQSEFDEYMNGVTALISSLKEFSTPRIGVIGVNAVAEEIISLTNNEYNDLNDDFKYINNIHDFEDLIRYAYNNSDRVVSDTINLYDGLSSAIQAFESTVSETPHRDRKLIIISSCTNVGGESEICHQFSNVEVGGEKVKISVVNIVSGGDITSVNKDSYLSCLTSNGPISSPSTQVDDIIDTLINEVCPEILTVPDIPCDTEDLGKSCGTDADCSGCLLCCTKRKICEMPRDSAAISMLNQDDINDNQYNFVEPNISGKRRFYEYPIFGYISFVGFILFIVTNNVFIGYWCCVKKNSKKNKFVKCDE